MHLNVTGGYIVNKKNICFYSPPHPLIMPGVRGQAQKNSPSQPKVSTFGRQLFTFMQPVQNIASPAEWMDLVQYVSQMDVLKLKESFMMNIPRVAKVLKCN